jgi:hypothetical protein
LKGRQDGIVGKGYARYLEFLPALAWEVDQNASPIDVCRAHGVDDAARRDELEIECARGLQNLNL